MQWKINLSGQIRDRTRTCGESGLTLISVNYRALICDSLHLISKTFQEDSGHQQHQDMKAHGKKLATCDIKTVIVQVMDTQERPII